MAQVTRGPRAGPNSEWRHQAFSCAHSPFLSVSVSPSFPQSAFLCVSVPLLSLSLYITLPESLCVSVSLSLSVSYAQRCLCYMDVSTVLSHLSYHLGFLSDSICFQNCVQTAQKRGDIKHFNLL